jgi:hypothetical protein
MYHEVETIIDWFSAWTVPQVKELGVRERKHWYKRAIAKMERTRYNDSKSR